MSLNKLLCTLAVAGLATFANGQTVAIVNNIAGTFEDISTTGGTMLATGDDDAYWNFTSTVGNTIFPAGSIRVNNNGFALSYAAVNTTTTGSTWVNSAIPAVGLPAGGNMNTGSRGIVMPHWSDLIGGQIWAKNDVANGVLIIMWKNEFSYPTGSGGPGAITFEAKVFATGTNLIQYIYPDVIFTAAGDGGSNGQEATIGFIKGDAAGSAGNNVAFSFDTQSIMSGTVLTVRPTPPTFQVNQAGASMVVNATNGSATSAATVNVTGSSCAAPTCAVVLSSSAANVGNPWDLGITGSVAVAGNAGGFQTSQPQNFNLLVAEPPVFLNSTFPATFSTTPWPGNFTLNPTFPNGFNCAAQFFVVDPTLADTVACSAATNLNATLLPGILVPTSDDGAAVYALSNPGLCMSTGSFSFFGVSYTQITVNMNGRVTFGSTSSASFSVGTSLASQPPGVGEWCDFNVTQNASGSVVLSTPSAGIVRVNYNHDAFYANPTLMTNWSIELNQNTGDMAVNGTGTWPLFPPASGEGPAVLGLNPAGVMTNPGPRSWVTGANPSTLLATDMAYMAGEGGTILTGNNGVSFHYNGVNYDVTVN